MVKIKAIAPSGKINPTKFTSGKKNLEDLFNCEVSTNPNIHETFRGMAGFDSNRLQDLLEGLQSEEYDIIWSIRGGFGATRVLKDIPQDLIIPKNKILIGYSDITAYQWLLYKFYTMKSISGQMIQVDFDTTENKQSDYAKLFSLLKNDKSVFDMPTQIKTTNWPNKVEGKIIGGCLSIISKIMGTPYVPDLEDHILFLEDVDEPIYRIDGYFSHLYNCGVFHKVKAVILGQFSPSKDENIEHYQKELQNVIDEYRKLINKPIIWNFPIGHINHIFPLPIGYNAFITRDQLEFRKTD